ncbi:MAG: double-strand break repair protein AddB [Variibacter sp.]
MAAPRPRVFTVPASAPFLPTLIRALADGGLVSGFSVTDDPLALASATIYLPTRRACRLAQDIFLDVLGADAAMLPRLTPLGDIDEDELVFAQAIHGPLAALDLDLPEALGDLERRLLLAQLILKWAQSPDVRAGGGPQLVANSPSVALALADALARLIDDMITRKVAWERLDTLVPEDVDHYWQLTLRFLQIARTVWPAVLAERGAIEPAARRDSLIAAETARLALHRDGPVIAAGSTGSMPATAALLTAVANLPQGAVVLPGLDTDLDAASWELVAESIGHPQYAMRGWLAEIGLHRDEVTPLASPVPHGRERLVSEALRPAEATDHWSVRLPDAEITRALADVSVIEAATAEEEAQAIAIALRGAMEDDNATAALITPDRALARRVIAALGRWNVAVDDSAGLALPDTPAGVFARLAAEAALGGLEPVTLLALLKHPYLRLGRGAGRHAYALSVLERALLRGPRPKKGSAGLTHALAHFPALREGFHRSDPRSAIGDAAIAEAQVLVAALGEALAPLETLPAARLPLADLARRHAEVVAALSRDADGGCAVFADEDGRALQTVFETLVDSTAASGFALAAGEYGEAFASAAAGRVVPNRDGVGARVRIYGLLEARLQSVDRVVLGGLVEGTWPPQTRSDPWLSRPMRQSLGLDLPERRIGLTAHDFAQALGAKEVVLSRAQKSGGAPTVASRFLQRLEAVAGKEAWQEARERGDTFVALARGLDHPAAPKRIPQPSPKPPLAARPLRLSVTQVEHLLRDPYTIYARHILGLVPLDAVDTPPGARDRGSALHEAVGDYTKDFAGGLPPHPLNELIARGERTFAPLKDFPEAEAFWWPRFVRAAQWFVGWDEDRRALIASMHAEVEGTLDIALGERTFRLVTRADRIERLRDGSVAILDYKTGTIPSPKQVQIGLSPQLTLEGAILRNGGFKDLPAGLSIREIAYVGLKGGDPGGFEKSIDFKDATPDAHADRALSRLKATLMRFEDETQGYPSLVLSMWRTRYGDYDHLARVKEWSETGGEPNEGMPP